jgi:hypothetical protein
MRTGHCRKSPFIWKQAGVIAEEESAVVIFINSSKGKKYIFELCSTIFLEGHAHQKGPSMQLPRWSFVFVISLVTLFLAIPATVRAQPAPTAPRRIDIIYLKDGSVVRGAIIDRVPGASITVRLETGEVIILNDGSIAAITPVKHVRRTVPRGHNELWNINYGTSLSLVNGYGSEGWYDYGLGARITNISHGNMLTGLTCINYFGSDVYPFNESVIRQEVVTLGADIGFADIFANCAFCPYVEPGVAFFTENLWGSASGVISSSTNFCFSPGLLWQWSFMSGLKLGIDVKYTVIVGPGISNGNSFSLMGQIGFKL